MIVPEAIDLDNEFEDVLFASWVPQQQRFKSVKHLGETLRKRGENLVQYQPAIFPNQMAFTTFSSVVKTSADRMVIFGEESRQTSQGGQKQIQHKAYFLNLNEPGAPEVIREWRHQSPVQIDHYIRYKHVVVLFSQDDFLHLYYKGRKSNLRLIGGKYFANGGYYNKGKKAFRRGKDLYYQNKYNKSRRTFITLMKLDLDLLIEQLEFAVKDRKHTSYDVNFGVLTWVTKDFVDFVMDKDHLMVLDSRGYITLIDLQNGEKVRTNLLPKKPKYEHKTISIAVPGKYFVIYCTNDIEKTVCFRLVDHQTHLVSVCVVREKILHDPNSSLSSEGYNCCVWGHFRKYRNSSIGTFFRPLGAVHVLAVLGSQIVHICEKGLGDPADHIVTNGLDALKDTSWIGIVPFSRQKKYYVFRPDGLVGLISLRL